MQEDLPRISMNDLNLINSGATSSTQHEEFESDPLASKEGRNLQSLEAIHRNNNNKESIAMQRRN